MADPVVAVYVDWANNGDFTNDYDDITSDVLSISWYRGASDWAGGSASGGATIVVDNTAGTYYPDNVGSTLHGLLLPGRRVWVKATHSLVTYGVFAGFVERIVPIVSGGDERAEIVCVDSLARWRKERVPLDANVIDTTSIGTARADLLVDVLGELSPVLASGEDADALVGIGAPKTDALSLLEDLNRANGSRHVIRPRSTVVGGGGSKANATAWEYVVQRRCDDLSDAAAADLTNVYAINGYEVSSANVINEVTVAYSQYAVDTRVSTLWTLERSFPWNIGPDTEVLIAELPSAAVDLVADIDLTAGFVNLTLEDCGTTAIISIDPGTYATVTGLRLEGRAVEITGASSVGSDGTSVGVYGPCSVEVSSTFLQSATTADGLRDYLLWRFGDPRKRPTVTLRQPFSTMLALEVFDVVTLSVDRLYVDGIRYEIVGLEGRMSPASGWSVEYTLQEMPEQGTLTGWFTIGTSSLDGIDHLAH